MKSNTPSPEQLHQMLCDFEKLNADQQCAAKAAATLSQLHDADTDAFIQFAFALYQVCPEFKKLADDLHGSAISIVTSRLN